MGTAFGVPFCKYLSHGTEYMLLDFQQRYEYQNIIATAWAPSCAKSLFNTLTRPSVRGSVLPSVGPRLLVLVVFQAASLTPTGTQTSLVITSAQHSILLTETTTKNSPVYINIKLPLNGH